MVVKLKIERMGPWLKDDNNVDWLVKRMGIFFIALAVLAKGATILLGF